MTIKGSRRLFLVKHPVDAMLTAQITSLKAAKLSFGHLPRALKPLGYVSGQACVNCGRGHFHVGRVSAECAHCGDVVSI
jgi:hypothetical protein